MRIAWGRVTAIFAFAALGPASCSTSSSPGSSAQTENAQCLTQTGFQVITDTTGAALAQAYTEHTPTVEERQDAAAFLVILANAAQEGTFNTVLFETDILPRMANLAAQYPSISQPCTVTLDVERSAPLAPSSLQPMAFDCNQSCLPSAREIATLVGEEVLFAKVEQTAKTLGGFLELDGEMSKAVAGYLTSGGKTLLGAGEALTSTVPQTQEDQILKTFGTLIDATGAAIQAAVMRGVPAAFAAEMLGVLGNAILADQLAHALLDAYDFYTSCGIAKDKNCSGPGPLYYCFMPDCTLGPCYSASGGQTPCVDPDDPSSCHPPAQAGNCGGFVGFTDGGAGEDGGSGCPGGCPVGEVCTDGVCVPMDAGGTDDGGGDSALPDPCGVAGTWSSMCPLGSASCSACGTQDAMSSYTVTPEVASAGGTWTDGSGTTYSFTPSDCTLTKSTPVSNPCFTGTRMYMERLSGGQGNYGGNFTCWTGTTCNCTGTNTCTDAKQ